MYKQGLTIRKYRLLKKMSQEDLAEKVGRTRQTIISYENKDEIKDIPILEDIISILGIPKDELYREYNVMESKKDVNESEIMSEPKPS